MPSLLFKNTRKRKIQTQNISIMNFLKEVISKTGHYLLEDSLSVKRIKRIIAARKISTGTNITEHLTRQEEIIQ